MPHDLTKPFSCHVIDHPKRKDITNSSAQNHKLLDIHLLHRYACMIES